MSQVAPEKVGLGRQVMRVLSWVIGVLLILTGLLFMVAEPNTGSIVMGIGLVVAGVLVLPPLVRRIRGHVGFARPIWVPPLASFGVFFVAMMVSAPMLAAADAASPEGKARIEAERAAAAEERATEIAEIERLVTEGTVQSTRLALRKLDAGRFREDVAEGGSLRPLFDRATAAAETAKVRGEVRGYIARLNETQPKVEAVFTGRPETELVITANLATLDQAARLLRDGEKFASDPEARPLMAKLRRTMAQKQAAAFPAMRAGYGRIKDQAVWENDMDITVQGGGNRTIRFIAGIFAANRNIARFEQNVRPVLSQMRFRRTQYEWYRGSEYTYYTLETPGDPEIGYWIGSTFMPVHEPE